MITLVKDTIDSQDIDRLVDWLKTYPKLTKGQVTIDLEKKFSNWLGRKYSVFVNSGSSANLLLLYSLKEGGYLENNKIVVPAISWATDLAPVIQLGLDPLLCDCNLEDLSVDLAHLEQIFQKEQPSALLFVSVLGLVPNIKKLQQLCSDYNVILLEDTCESMGCEHEEKKLGTFGLASTFSTYFGHHISTIEGGFISTDDKDLYELLVSMRSHGWDRDLSRETQLSLRKDWDVPDFNALYTFYYSGFNFRSTDLQAYIGLTQIDKLDDWGEKRESNFKTYQELIDNEFWMPYERPNTFVSNFAYPVVSPNRDKIVLDLQKNNIEVRPMISGSMGTQPFYIKSYGRLELKNATIIDKYGFYIPNHPKLSFENLEFISKIINQGNQK
mgnify:FL=1|tara:strand:- start:129 stop:1283 length:1155 start_codon:yes stop_codon:yes gene_type:complete